MNKIASIILKAFRGGNKVLICGNGGSASQSNHFAGEFLCKFREFRRALPAISLTADNATLTAIGNDFGFENVFSRQVEALGNKGDVLIALSTSGKSKNVLKAIEVAQEQELVVIDFPRKGSNVARIQEYQLKLMHQICDIVEQAIIKQDNKGQEY